MKDEELIRFLRESEKRVSNVNEITNNLVKVMKSIETTYIKHIDKLVRARDVALNQNTMLLRQNSRLMTKVSSLEMELRMERDKYIEHLKSQLHNSRVSNNKIDNNN